MAWEPNDLDLRANYDLGVEAGKALREQEIIKLLEEKCHCGMVMHKGYMVKRICPAHTHIALINGEEK